MMQPYFPKALGRQVKSPKLKTVPESPPIAPDRVVRLGLKVCF